MKAALILALAALAPATALAAKWEPVGAGGLNIKAQRDVQPKIEVVYDDPPTIEYGHINALAVYKGELYAAGLFDMAGGKPAANIAKWDGTTWSPVGAGLEGGYATTLYVFRDELYIGGNLKNGSGLAKWDGKTLAPVPGFDSEVVAMTTWQNDLIAAGVFTTAGGVPAKSIARFDGKKWFALGKGLPNDPYAIAVFNGELYAGGTFLDAAKPDLDNLYKWNGKRWAGAGAFDGAVTSLVANGKTLYASGFFTHQKKTETGGIAQTTGTKWTSTGGGLAWPQPHSKDHITTITAIDGALYAGGHLPTVKEVPFGAAAMWNGKTWTPVADGIEGDVRALALYKGDLYAAGDFSVAGDAAEGVSNIARLKKETAMTPPGAKQENVGVATMTADGTINLQLRSEDHGMIAEALKVVHKGDADYDSTLKHLGGLKPGESKPIPPYPAAP